MDITDPTLVGVIVAFLLIVLTSIFLRRGGQKGNRVLFVGLPTAGKTALFYRLLDDTVVASHTSMVPNRRNAKIGGCDLSFVDYPGHSRLRQGLAQELHHLRAIVFVIDACDVDQTLSDNAAFLVDLLTDPKILTQNPPPSLAIACTKRDQAHSYKSTAVRRRLEREMEEVRRTKASAVGQMGEEGDKATISLGVATEKFDFDKHSGIPTEFVDCAAVDSGADAFFTGAASSLRSWLEKVTSGR